MVNIIFNEYYVNRLISIHKHISYRERISVVHLDDKSYRTIDNRVFIKSKQLYISRIII